MEFIPGQQYNYETRENEKGSYITILKVEEGREKGKKIIHIRVDGIKMKNPQQKEGSAKEMPHMPFSEEALLKSKLKFRQFTGDIPDFSGGYNEWKNANGGVFTITVSEAIEYAEQALNSK